MSGGKKIQDYFAKLRQSEDEGIDDEPSQTESEAGDQSQNEAQSSELPSYYVTM